VQEDCLALFSTREELENAASEMAAAAPDEYQHSTYLYFLARFLVAVYEAKFGEIPIQVWNEYRNALDHFYRYITRPPELDSPHLSRMEGHVQRAVLDVAKIFCHDSQGKFDDLLERENYQCLRLVDNGHFHTELFTLKTSSEELFTKAKITDSALGDNAQTDKEVLTRYLEAYFSYITLLNLFTSHRGAIDNATNEYDNLHARAVQSAESHGFWGHVRASLLSKLIWVPLTAGITFIATKYWSTILSFFDSIVSAK
jgi:hypothetical protein